MPNDTLQLGSLTQPVDTRAVNWSSLGGLKTDEQTKVTLATVAAGGFSMRWYIKDTSIDITMRRFQNTELVDICFGD